MKKNYKVGYRKPPSHTRFQPGQSGNPKGRPKQEKIMSARYKYLLDEPIDVQHQGKIQQMSPKEISLRKILKKALEKGDMKSIRYLIEQFEKHGILQEPEHESSVEVLFFNEDGTPAGRLQNGIHKKDCE